MTAPRKLGRLTFLARFVRDTRGVSSVLLAIMSLVFVELTGLVVDFGHVFWVKTALQAQTDAAALAGGYNIPNSTAITTATSYSGTSSNLNAISKVPATFVTGFPVLKCLTSVSIAGLCTGTELAGGANAIVVKEQSVVPMYFTRVVGISSLTVAATSTASARGGPGQNLNVMIILDTTASMGGQDNSCGLGNSTREQCALAGVQALLKGLNPTLDYVGIDVFPGLGTAAEAATEYCSGGSFKNSYVQSYVDTPVYQVVGLSGSNNFKTAANANTQTLNTSSNIVAATGGSGSCAGIQNPGGEKTYFAAAINDAQSQLTAFASPHTQNVIIVLSDGGANATGSAISDTFNATTTKNSKTVTVSGSPSGPLSAGQTVSGNGIPSGTTISSVSGNTVTLSAAATASGFNVSMTAVNKVTFNGTTYAQNTEECLQAISAAKAAAAAGTWVYSIAYGADSGTGNNSNCTTDTADPSPYTGISTCTTMEDIASDLSKFYSDGSGGSICANANSISNLVQVFQNISIDLTEPRIIPDNTA